MDDLIALFITPALLIVFGLIYKLNPPNEINYLYGYRTRRSMANKKVWNYANKLGAKMIIDWGIYSAMLSVAAYILIPNYAIIISLVGLLFLLIILYLRTERQIDRHFDKNGNPR